jgi:hypothetical protein
MKVVAQDFGTKVLLRGEPGDSGQMLQGEPMLDALEGLLNAPAGAVQIAKVCSGIVDGVEQGGHENMHPPGGCHHAHESDLSRFPRTAIVLGISNRGRRQCHDGLCVPRASETDHLGKLGIVDAHAEMEPPGEEHGHQPAGGVAAIEHQQVVASETVQMLKQHLPFGYLGRIQFKIERYFAAGQIHHEGDGLPNLPSGGILEKQLELGGIGGDDAEPAPARQGQTRLDEMQQGGIEPPEHGSGKPLAGLRKRLRGHLALEVCGALEVGGKSVEFLLDTAIHAGEHEGQQFGERQVTSTEKGGG